MAAPVGADGALEAGNDPARAPSTAALRILPMSASIDPGLT
jgi:hypothetical protein